MKNFKFLLATTAILSMGAIAANATGVYGSATGVITSHLNVSNTETIHMDVKFVEPLSITERAHLDFGTIKSPRSGQTVILNNDRKSMCNGYNEYGGTATQLYTSGTGAPHMGRMEFTGSTTGYSVGNMYDLYFANDSIDLTDGGNTTCGTVSGFETPYAGVDTGLSDGFLCYSATFTVDQSITADTPFQGSCSGTNTVTVVYTQGN